MTSNQSPNDVSKKTVAGICGILVGALGVHKFILGYTQAGTIMLLVTLIGSFITCGLSGMAMAIIGLVEGITYLSMSEEKFQEIYIQNKKGWF